MYCEGTQFVGVNSVTQSASDDWLILSVWAWRNFAARVSEKSAYTPVKTKMPRLAITG